MKKIISLVLLVMAFAVFSACVEVTADLELDDDNESCFTITEDDVEFDCFIIQGRDEEEAQMMLDEYLDAKKAMPIQKTETLVSIKDRYYDLIFLSRKGRYICGVMKIKEGKEEIGKEYLRALLDSF